MLRKHSHVVAPDIVDVERKSTTFAFATERCFMIRVEELESLKDVLHCPGSIHIVRFP